MNHGGRDGGGFVTESQEDCGSAFQWFKARVKDGRRRMLYCDHQHELRAWCHLVIAWSATKRTARQALESAMRAVVAILDPIAVSLARELSYYVVSESTSARLFRRLRKPALSRVVVLAPFRLSRRRKAA